MSRYRKYTDNYKALAQALRLTDEGGFPLEEISKQKYSFIINRDGAAATPVELRSPDSHNVETTRSDIYNIANFADHPFYGQGEYDARVVYFTTNLNPNLNQLYQQSGDPEYKNHFGFAYINDQGVPCGLSVVRLGHESKANYLITVIRNIHAPYDERDVTFICSEDIIRSDYYAAMHGKHHEEPLLDTDIMRTLRPIVSSPQVAEVISGLFNDLGSITEENFENLRQRIGHHNLDNRDLLLKQIPIIIGNTKKINPDLAAHIQSLFKNDYVDFFRETRYRELLEDLVISSQKMPAKNPEVIQIFQDLYLEYLTIQIYYSAMRKRPDPLKGLEAEFLNKLQDQYTQGTKDDPVDAKKFAQRANQFYKNIELHELISKLEFALQGCDIPSLNAEATAQVRWLRNIGPNFLNLKPSKQKTILTFATSLLSFVDNPIDETYQTLHQLYPKVSLATDTLEVIKQDMEKKLFKEQIMQLQQHIMTSKHPYVRRELAKHGAFLREEAQSFHTISTDRQIALNLFLQHLNTLGEFNSEGALKDVTDIYAQFERPPLSAEESKQILLSPNIANMQYEIEQGHYLLDSPAHVLVSTLDPTNHNQTTLWSLDANTHPNALAKFNQSLSAALQKQTTAVFTGKILELFHHNKSAIFPLQQAVEVYLNQIAQIYQSAMQPKAMSDVTRHTAFLTTIEAINGEVFKTLSQGLMRASFNTRQALLQKLDTTTLNKILIEAQDTLRQQGKNLLIENMRAQFQQQLPHSSTPEPQRGNPINKVVDFDTTQSLATVIESQEIAPNYSCRQIKSYRCQGAAFALKDELKHLRLHSTGLNIPDGMSVTTYQNQFQHRIMQMADIYRINYSHPLNYYVYGASDIQIQESMAAIHIYNRNVRTGDISETPLCFIQACDLSEPGRMLGYGLFASWGSNTSEMTLMLEMTLCEQITRDDAQKSFTLQPYYYFLNTEPSLFTELFPSSLFVLRPEGKQMRKQIQDLKTAWQQDRNLNDHLTTQQSVALAIKKMMAFDLHYEPQHALLVQSLSLANQNQALLQDQTLNQGVVLALGGAQIFDLPALPKSIQELLKTLVRATDKRTVSLTANLLQTEMQEYCAQHQNAALLLPISQKATEAAHAATSTQDIERTNTHFLTPIEAPKPQATLSSRRAHRIEKNSHSSPSPANGAASLARSRHGLFANKPAKQTDSVLDKAARNKAAAFGKRGKFGQDE